MVNLAGSHHPDGISLYWHDQTFGFPDTILLLDLFWILHFGFEIWLWLCGAAQGGGGLWCWCAPMARVWERLAWHAGVL